MILFAPDGKSLVSVRGQKVTFNDLTGKQLRELDHGGGQIDAVAFSPDGSRLVTTIGKTITFWQTTTGKKLQEVENDVAVTHLAYTHDGKTLVLAGGKTLAFWDVAQNGKQAEKELLLGTVTGIAISPDNQTVAILTAAKRTEKNTGTVRFVDIATCQARPLGKLSGSISNVIAWSRNGLLALKFDDPRDCGIRLWDVQNDRERARHVAPGPIRQVVFSHDGARLAIGGDFSNADVWAFEETLTKSEPPAIFAHGRQVLDLAFSPDAQMLAVVGHRNGKQPLGEVSLWNVKDPTHPRPHRRLDDVVALSPQKQRMPNEYRSVTFSPDGTLLAVPGGTSFPTVYFWDASSGAPRSPWVGDKGPQRSSAWLARAAFSLDGRMLLAISGGGDLHVIERSRMDQSRVFSLRGDPMNRVGPGPELSADAATFAKGASLFATTTGEFQTRLFQRGGQFLAVSPDRKTLATVSSFGGDPAGNYCEKLVCKVGDFGTGKEDAREFVAEREPTSVEIKPVGLGLTKTNLVLAAVEQQGPRRILRIHIWDVATGQRRRLFETDAPINVAAFALSSDGSKVAVGGYSTEKGTREGKIILWRIE
jgi:WD40 repeat protein